MYANVLTFNINVYHEIKIQPLKIKTRKKEKKSFFRKKMSFQFFLLLGIFTGHLIEGKVIIIKIFKKLTSYIN